MSHRTSDNPAVHVQRGRDVYLLTPKEAGSRLGVSQNTVYRMIGAGEISAVDVAPESSTRSKTRVRSDEVDRFIDNRTRTAPSRQRIAG